MVIVIMGMGMVVVVMKMVVMVVLIVITRTASLSDKQIIQYLLSKSLMNRPYYLYKVHTFNAEVCQKPSQST